jgi:zinc D-Ala-D-Ala carboxypeptidase
MARTSDATWIYWALGITGAALGLGLFNRERVMSDLKTVRLSPNFTLDEFVRTSTGLDNIPGPVEIEKLRALVVNVLQPLRDAIARKYPGAKVAVNITSGFRSLAVNQAIGGSSTTSQHMKGEAADFNVTVNGVRLSNQEIIDTLRAQRLPYDQVIDEQLRGKVWVHVSHALSNRKMWLTARDGAQGTQYTTVQYG